MIRVRIGDIFASSAHTLVNTVNCVGVMGKGVALEFKKRFPEMYADYAARCKQGHVKLGEPYLFRRTITPWIINFPTKDHWRSVSKLDDIVRGLDYLASHVADWGVRSLAVPPLGCGHGQLDWQVVGPTLYQHLSSLSVPVELFAPFGTAEEELQESYLRRGADAVRLHTHSRVRPAWVCLVEVLRRIEQEPFRPMVGRVTFQKLAYFATQVGIPTHLQYTRGSYGPYAPGLKRLTSTLLNNGLLREERAGRMFAVSVGPSFEDARATFKAQLDGWNDNIERIADLFLRMNTHQAELAATVHFAWRHLENLSRTPTELEVLREVCDWKQKRKPPLTEGEIAGTVRHLAMLRWLNVAASDLPVSGEEVLGA